MFNLISSIIRITISFNAKFFVGLLIFSTFVALIEAAGVASVFPLISVFVSGGNLGNIEYISNISSQNKFLNEFISLENVATLILILLAASIILRALYTYLQYRFCYILEHKLGVKLLAAYLSHSYLWLSEKNSSDMIKSILSEVSEFVNNGARPVINIFAQLFLILFVVGVVIAVDPIAAFLSASILFLTYILTYAFVKRLLFNIGAERFEANQKRFRILNEAFGAIKELKLYRLENYYRDTFKEQSYTFAIKQAHAQLTTFIPRYLIELVAFFGFFGALMMHGGSGDRDQSIFASLALYAMAGYKIMPAVQQVYSNFAQLRYASKSVLALLDDLKEMDHLSSKADPVQCVAENYEIRFDNVTFRYPSSATDVIKNMSFLIRSGETVAFVGATGSGKSTAVDLMLGLLKPNSGSVVFYGNELQNIPQVNLKAQIGYVPQHSYIADRSISENVKFYDKSGDLDLANVQHALEVAQIKDFIEECLPDRYSSVLGERGARLSGGQLQRIAIARALYLRPKILVFDEATSALDSVTERAVIESVKKSNSNSSILMVSHRVQSLRSCDRIFVFDAGTIVAEGSFEFLTKHSRIFQNLLKT